MFEKIKNIFNEENKKRKNENIVFFIILLVITLIIINIILKKDTNTFENQNDINNTIELVKQNQNQIINNSGNNNENLVNDELEIKLSNILKSIQGVGNVNVLITYQESNSIVPIYNINNSSSVTEEKDSNGGTRTTTTDNDQKEVVSDNNNEIITEKVVMPIVQGAIITAQGATDINVKSNIISAVEAVTGLATHKIQVFEMGE